MKILVTGGAGFIGSNFLNRFVPMFPQHRFINMDALTYASNLRNLEGIEGRGNYVLERGDIADYQRVKELYEKYDPDLVIHFAAESHVDRSISGPAAFIRSNINGTFHLLEACRELWGGNDGRRFHHVSTDEVYGSLGPAGYFTEATPYDPSSPYSASKAASDHLVRAYARTYGIPVTITNCSNNYGPYQFPEKLIPLMIVNALEQRPLPVYGRGENIRDWIYVDDHCDAVWTVVQKGAPGETYNIGGNSERKNIDIVYKICEILEEETGRVSGSLSKLVQFVADRPGHDFRYAVDCRKITRELGWQPVESFETGLKKTVQWYLGNREWLKSVQTGEYRRWLKDHYKENELS